MSKTVQRAMVVLVTSAVVFLLLGSFRALIFYHEWTKWSAIDLNWSYLARTTLRMMGQDAFVLLVLTIISLGLLPLLRAFGIVLHLGMMVPVVVLGAVNVKVTSLYGAPATLSLLRFAGLSDPRALATIIDYADRSDLVLIAGATLLLMATPVITLTFIRTSWIGQAFVAVTSALALVGLLGLSARASKGSEADIRRHGNALAQLVISALTPDPLSAAETSSMRSHDPFAHTQSSESPISRPATERQGLIQNVVVLVLESVGAHYFDPVNQPHLTPNLSDLLSGSAYFPNAYAHAPSSSMALFAVLAGMYPPAAMQTMPDMDPEMPLPTIVSEVKSRGLRTGFFMSAGWSYAGYTDFLHFQGAELVETGRSRAECPPDAVLEAHFHAEVKADFTATKDECTAASMMRWIGKSKEPFFALLWTNRTHYPYRTSDATELSEAIPDTHARYLNGIRDTDRLIGDVVTRLRKDNRLDQTLIVVVGDHGEGFGQHGAVVHGHHIYDEFMRVPLILINPRLFSGTVRHDVVGHIDIAPTILDALGGEPPSLWHGRTLFGPTIRERTFFAVPWSSVLLGFRSGPRKVSYEVTTEKVEIYDLTSDPGEANNLAPDLSRDEIQTTVERLWSWKNMVGDQYTTLGRRPGSITKR